ncbi:MAG TPA: AAA family ATPase [Steroidobacteraceae bacterium]|nr:AAA family ATPase [Steroidobacteraceae bacterium]
MTLHKLMTDREARAFDAPSLAVNLDQKMFHVADGLVRARAVQACEFDVRRLPVHRTRRWSVRRKLELFFDDIALDAAFQSFRVDDGVVLLTASGLFVYAGGSSKSDYTSCYFNVWAESAARAEEALARLEAIAGANRLRDETFTIDWQFTTATGELRNSSFQELADPVLADAAYPSLGRPVNEFIAAYIAAPECALILMGPPGTGKTRLVRAILAEISRRKGENALVMYTADKRALAGDEIFVEFVTGSHDAFVIEDSDLLLKARTSGNEDMHRFLATADGVARSQGRKIIFTTNLPNVSDIDDALIRPGRCFGIRNLRNLTPEEAAALAAHVCQDAERTARAQAALLATAAKSYSVAQVYRVCAI